MRLGWQILEVWSAPKHFPNPEAGTGTEHQTLSCNTSAKYVATVSGDASHPGWGELKFIREILSCIEWFPDPPPPKKKVEKKKEWNFVGAFSLRGELVLSIKLYLFLPFSHSPSRYFADKSKFLF